MKKKIIVGIKMKKTVLSIFVICLLLTTFIASGNAFTAFEETKETFDSAYLTDTNKVTIGEAKLLVYEELNMIENVKIREEMLSLVDIAFLEIEQIGVTDDMTLDEAEGILQDNDPIVLRGGYIINFNCDIDMHVVYNGRPIHGLLGWLGIYTWILWDGWIPSKCYHINIEGSAGTQQGKINWGYTGYIYIG